MFGSCCACHETCHETVLECALHCQVRDVVGMFVGMFDARKMKMTKTMNDGDDACVCVRV